MKVIKYEPKPEFDCPCYRGSRAMDESIDLCIDGTYCQYIYEGYCPEYNEILEEKGDRI